MGVEKSDVTSAAAAEFKLTSTVNCVVGVGGLSEPTGTTMLPSGPLVSTAPVAGLMVVHPCRRCGGRRLAIKERPEIGCPGFLSRDLLACGSLPAPNHGWRENRKLVRSV